MAIFRRFWRWLNQPTATDIAIEKYVRDTVFGTDDAGTWHHVTPAIEAFTSEQLADELRRRGHVAYLVAAEETQNPPNAPTI